MEWLKELERKNMLVPSTVKHNLWLQVSKGVRKGRRIEADVGKMVRIYTRMVG